MATQSINARKALFLPKLLAKEAPATTIITIYCHTDTALLPRMNQGRHL